MLRSLLSNILLKTLLVSDKEWFWKRAELHKGSKQNGVLKKACMTAAVQQTSRQEKRAVRSCQAM